MYFKLTHLRCSKGKIIRCQLNYTNVKGKLQLLPRISYEQNDFRWKNNLMRNSKSDTEEVVVDVKQ